MRRLFLIIPLVMSGCSTYPSDPPGRARHHIEIAQEAIQKGDTRGVRVNFEYAANQDASAVGAYLSQNPEALKAYAESVKDLVSLTDDAAELISARKELVAMYFAEALPEPVFFELDGHFKRRARQGNLDGSLPFVLGQDIASLGLEKDNEQMDAIVSHTIASILNAQGDRRLDGLMNYAAQDSTPTQHRAQIEAALDSFYVRKAELDIVQPVFPAFAERRREALESIGVAQITVSNEEWNSLSVSEQAAIRKHAQITTIPAGSFGLIVDVQSADRSTAATQHGAELGSSAAQLGYLDRSVNRGSYSAWSQIGFGLLGALIGSSVDQDGRQEYEYQYTIKRPDGNLSKIQRISGSAFHHAVGTCVSTPSLDPLPQGACDQTAESLRQKLLRL